MSTRGETLRIGTRGSDLATWQARHVKEKLTQRRISVELVEVQTTGDQIRDELIHELGTTGAFVRQLDRKVLDGELDAAVHSMKDMPTDQPEELVVAGLPERATAADVLVTPDDTQLEHLPPDAAVGTSSLRRGAQILAERPDLEIVPLRGNVDTRVEKLLAPTLQREHEARLTAEETDFEEYKDPDGNDETASGGGTEDTTAGGGNVDTSAEDGSEGTTAGDGSEGAAPEDSDYERTAAEWFEERTELERQALGREVETEYDAICLAEAGLERSGLLDQLHAQQLDLTRIVPAPAQGAIAITAVDGPVAERINEILDHPPTRVETTVERTILGELGGGCVAPVGIHARLQGAVLKTTVRVLARDGTEELVESRDLPVESHARAAREFAASLAEQGATELIERARREEPDDAKRS